MRLASKSPKSKGIKDLVLDFGPNGARVWSGWMTFTVRAPLYRVSFDTIKCLDESDLESGVSDEIVTTWAVCADSYLWTKQTGEYDDFDDDTGSYRLRYTVSREEPL